MTSPRTALFLILAASTTPALADQITCHSSGSQPEPCGTVQAGSSVRLARQLGSTACVEGRNWGTGPDRDSIWVSGGCSAVFDVQAPARGDAYANADRSSTAATGRSAEWQRGYDDGHRGNADPNDSAQDYLEGYRAGEDAAHDDSRYDAHAPSANRAPSDNAGVFESVPNPPATGSSDNRGPPPGARNGMTRNPPPDDYAGNGAPPSGDQPPPSDDRYPPPPPDDRRLPPEAVPYDERHGARYANIDHARAGARRACVEAAAADRRFGSNRIITRDVRWIGHGQFAVGLATPEGDLTCTVDRDGNVLSIDGQ